MACETCTRMCAVKVGLIRSVKRAIVGTLVCLHSGSPLSNAMTKEGRRCHRVAMLLIVLPMWVNFLLRTYSMMDIME